MEETHSLLEVDDDGVIIRMMDGSEWEVSVGDSTKSCIWVPTARINIEESDDELYPYIITNLDTYGPDKVSARRIV